MRNEKCIGVMGVVINGVMNNEKSRENALPGFYTEPGTADSLVGSWLHSRYCRQSCRQLDGIIR